MVKGGEKMLLLCVDPDNLSNLNSAALGGTHQFKVKSILSPLPPPPLFDFLPLSCFSYLFLFPFCNNYVSGGKCNYKGVGLVGSVCVCVWRGGVDVCVCVRVIALHAQQNATLKTYYQKREHFGRYMAEGSSRHMFVETGTTSQVVIINHHQERPVKNARPGTL